ncbi:MAG: adenylate/guanylate cyclase domain-containing protein [Alphaproteobacteria bacterium]|nr:adenylate/guanylate cyclase domain-containing protein [Alphaproteobacteria bacterium]
MTGAESLRGELAASIDRTLVAEARRNELTIALVRFATALGMIGFEIWLFVGGSKLDGAIVPAAGLTIGFAVWAGVLAAYLRQGRWSPVIPWLVPCVDLVYFAMRQGLSFAMVGVAHFKDVQDLTTVLGFAAVLTLTGAYRLSQRSVALAAGLGFAIYVVFAALIELHPFFALIHLLLLGAMAGAATGLTAIVQRAVHGEVTRLTLARLLPAPVLEAADADPLALLAEPRSLEATVVVTDLRGFTHWAEHRTPLEVLAFLNTVQGALAEVVHRHGGTVDKFMGDGMLAVFGAPEPCADHALRAVSAAREMLGVVERIGTVQLGIGIHSGELVVGCLGSGVRMEFTVLGDTVNMASRLEAATKEHGVPVLVSGPTAAQVPPDGMRRVGEVAIRGRDAHIEVFTLV